MCSYGMIWIKRRIQEEVATAWILCDKGFESRVMELLTSTPFSSLSLGYELIRIDLLSEPKQIKEDIYADTESSLIEIDVRASGEFILRPLGYMSSKSINEVDPDSLIKFGGHPKLGHLRLELKNKRPVTLDELWIDKEDIESLHISKVTGEMIQSKIFPEKNSEGAVIDMNLARVTAKQTTVIVSLLRAIGLTDEELKGSTPKLLAKLQNIAAKNGIDLPDIDPKTWREWLSREGVR
nr:MAG TPA: hypothetical protein [Caudoviricetes sp.]